MNLTPELHSPEWHALVAVTTERLKVCRACPHGKSQFVCDRLPPPRNRCGDVARENRCPEGRFPDPAATAWRDEPASTRYARRVTLRGGGEKRYIDLNHRGGHNGTVTDFGGGRLCAFRPNEGHRLRWAMLNPDLSPRPGRCGELGLNQNDDPRFVWHDGRLYMSTSYWWGWYQGSRIELREVAATPDGPALRDVGKFDRIDDWPDYPKPKWEKNWAPFVGPGGLHYVYSINPHRILTVDLEAGRVRLSHHTEAAALPWSVQDGSELRGSAPPALLSDGSYLSTFHVRRGQDYFTGFYRFEGAPPFRVTAMSADPVLWPEDSEGMCQRNSNLRLLFICGMDVDEPGDRVTLYGGDNDNSVIVVDLSLSTILARLASVRPGIEAVTTGAFFDVFRGEPYGGRLGMLTATEMGAMIALARCFGCKRLAEFGVGTGVNAAAFLAACPGVESFVGVDVPPGTVPTLQYQRVEVPAAAGAEVRDDARFRLIVRPRGTLDLTPADLGPLDFVFIDGDHSPDAVRRDTELARSAVQRGVICWHDYANPPAVGPSVVIDELNAAEGGRIRRLANSTLCFEVRG